MERRNPGLRAGKASTSIVLCSSSLESVQDSPNPPGPRSAAERRVSVIRSLAVRHSSFTSHRSLLITYRPSPIITHHSSFIVHQSSSLTTHQSSFTTHISFSSLIMHLSSLINNQSSMLVSIFAKANHFESDYIRKLSRKRRMYPTQYLLVTVTAQCMGSHGEGGRRDVRGRDSHLQCLLYYGTGSGRAELSKEIVILMPPSMTCEVSRST